MSCFSPSSSRPKKPWRCLISALQKKVNNSKNSKPFHSTPAKYASSTSYHRHFRHQINPEPPSIPGVGCRFSSDDANAVLNGRNDDDDDDDDDGGVIVLNESVKLHANVDANAEEFIEKMREYWKLERQKSVENYMEIVSRFYEY